MRQKKLAEGIRCMEETDLRYFSDGEISTILRNLNKEEFEVAMAIILAVTTGILESEITALKWTDFKIVEDNIVSLHVNKVYIKINNDQYATEYLSNSKVHTKLIKSKEFMEIYYTNKSVGRLFWSTPDTLTDKVNKYFKRLGLPELGLEGLRHTLVIKLLRRGLTLDQVSYRVNIKVSTIRSTYKNFIPKTELFKINYF